MKHCISVRHPSGQEKPAKVHPRDVKRSVSILSCTLADNAFGRAWVLAELLSRDFDVHVVAACRPRDALWPPAQESFSFELRRWKIATYPAFRMLARERARRLVTGDIIYAVKPQLSTFGLGLEARKLRNRPLVLDIDDFDAGMSSLPRDLLFSPWALLSCSSTLHTRLLTRHTGRADAVTISSTPLYERHGGTWIPHARDENTLVAALAEPERTERTVMFLGTPRKHKGVDVLVRAFRHVRAPARLRIVGGADNAELMRAVRRVGDARISVEPLVPMTAIPSLLAMSDVVAIPQSRGSFSAAQLPAKLLDAMAMGKAIVSTRVGDIPKWLAGGAGIVVEPDDPNALGLALDALLRDGPQLRRLGARARERFLLHGSFAQVRPRLVELFERLARGQRAGEHPPFAGDTASRVA
jgi:glycosyltransferase involved in cell wall biosynthesis